MLLRSNNPYTTIECCRIDASTLFMIMSYLWILQNKWNWNTSEIFPCNYKTIMLPLFFLKFYPSVHLVGLCAPAKFDEGWTWVETEWSSLICKTRRWHIFQIKKARTKLKIIKLWKHKVRLLDKKMCWTCWNWLIN